MLLFNIILSNIISHNQRLIGFVHEGIKKSQLDEAKYGSDRLVSLLKAPMATSAGMTSSNPTSVSVETHARCFFIRIEMRAGPLTHFDRVERHAHGFCKISSG